MQVATCVAGGSRVRLDTEDDTIGADLLGEERREQPDTRIEINDPLTWSDPCHLQHGADQRVRGGRVHLPEASGRHPELAAADPFPYMAAALDAASVGVDDSVQVEPGQRSASIAHDRQPFAGRRHHCLDAVGVPPVRRQVGERRVGDRARVDRDDVVRTVSVKAEPMLGVDREVDPGTPSQPVTAVGVLDNHVVLDAREPPQLFRHDAAEQRTLGRQVDMLEVASAAPTGSGYSAPALHSSQRRAKDLDRVGAQVRGRLSALGDLRPHAFTGQGVANEDDSALVPSDAVATMGDRVDVELHDLADEVRRHTVCMLDRPGFIDGHRYEASRRGRHPPTVVSDPATMGAMNADDGPGLDFSTGARTAPDLNVEWIHGSIDRKRGADPLIQVHRCDPHTYILRQSMTVSFEAPFMYLLFGNDRALLLDTGATKDPSRFPLRQVVDEVVESWLDANPRDGYDLVVAHTHAHRDHITGDAQFAGRPHTTVVGTDLAAVRSFLGFDRWPDEVVTFDLGGRVLEVTGCPGHHETSVAVFDPWTGFLLTGDTVYPGRLYVADMNALVDSLQRLVFFAGSRDVTHVMGCHVEMRRQAGRDYPMGSTYQPDEAALPMNVGRLTAVRDAAITVAHRPGVHRFDDFIIFNGPCRAGIALQMARGAWDRTRNVVVSAFAPGQSRRTDG